MVTALFADIKGSMELMEDLDPEEARAIVDPALKLMIDAVRRYDGYIVQSTGDGIFALFGAPVAHEDHPQRALYAALRLQEATRRYSAKLVADGGTPLEARVGINTGEVVVRTLTTADGHAEYTPIGHTANLASRMEAIAPTGSIAITEHTRRLVEGYFQLKSRGPTRVKGLTEPINVYEVMGLGPLRTRLQRAAVRGLTKFVGRESEIEALRHAAELARAGHGQLVAAIGEPGAGKSRLFHEFKLISQSDWMTLEAISLSHGKATAYLPLLELLREYFRIIAADDLRTRREKVTGRVVALDRSLEDTLPYLFALIGLSDGDEQLTQMDAQLRRHRSHEAIKRILLRESLNQPLMLIFEDLHWIDGETQALLNLLIDAIANARILLLVNYRPEYRHEWGNRTYYTQLRLDPLGRASAEQMLDTLLSMPLAQSFAAEGKRGDEPRAGEGADLTALKRLIMERTEGNPFFMEETVQALLDEGALVRDGALRLTKPLGDLKIPLTVQAMIAARIDRLAPAEKELLQTLAVIGKELALELIEGVTGRREEQLQPMLIALRLGEFIYEQPSLAGLEYTFKHALTQEVAYNSILAERRRVIHEQTARSIEKLHAQQLEDHWSELTHHYLRGIDAAKAVHYARLAAEQAVSRSAYPEAAGIIEAALKLLDRIPDVAERDRAELALRRVEWGVLYLRFSPSSPELECIALRMSELGEKIGQSDELLRGLLPLARLYFNRGEPLRGLAPARRCLQLAEVSQDPRLVAEVRFIAGVLALSSGSLREAVSRIENLASDVEQPNLDFFVGPFPARLVPPFMLVTPMQLLGRVDEAAKLFEEGLRRARDSRHRFSLSFALTGIGGRLRCVRREPEIVIAQTEEGIALAAESGFATWVYQGRFYHGWALAELGQSGPGVTEMEEGVAGLRKIGGAPFLSYAAALLAHAYARIGRTEQGLTMINETLAHIEHTGEKVDHSEMLRLKAEVLLMRDRSATAEAEHCFRTALVVARAQEAKWWELRTSVSLARLLRDTNRRDEARTMLSEIYNWFSEGFDLPDLKDARSLLDELSR
jgi:class 3 adenylate cyclase/tetratricopeptide (TPR) repeat protein